MKSFDYFAFISYSHKDQELAKRLKKRLQSYHLPSRLQKSYPNLPKNLKPIFLDESNLVALSGSLQESLQRNLDNSNYLIVLCSPNSAKSEYVNDEIKHFIEIGRRGHVVPLIVDGVPHSGDDTECFPPALRDLPREHELLGVDMTKFGERDAFLRVIATMLELNLDKFISDERLMPFQIIRSDITKVEADVIVNTANPKPVIGSGTDKAIYRAAGRDELLEERRKIGNIAPGQAVVTPAFRLSAKYIIHTVGPEWIDGTNDEEEILRLCYSNSLSLAAELKANSIAFPLIATGIYGFPKDDALNIAMAEIGKFLLTHEIKVILVVFDKKAFELSGQLVGRIDEYIDEHGVELARQVEYSSVNKLNSRRHIRKLPVNDFAVPLLNVENKNLDDVLAGAGDSFRQRLFKLIDDSGMDDIMVYKKANIDRKVFSRIRSKENYKPKKQTAVALAIALKLDMPTMFDLLSRAGIAFSPSNKFDLIITYFVTNGIYDIFEINAALFKYGQPILGE